LLLLVDVVGLQSTRRASVFLKTTPNAARSMFKMDSALDFGLCISIPENGDF